MGGGKGGEGDEGVSIQPGTFALRVAISSSKETNIL